MGAVACTVFREEIERMKKSAERLTRKSVLLNARKLEQIRQRLNASSESEAIRMAIDNLLLEDEVMGAVESLRKRGTAIDAYQRATSSTKSRATSSGRKIA
jgi:glutamyl/glutaminyl-tRNA synthetase